MASHAEPLIHLPIYCWPGTPDRAMRSMVQQAMVSLHSYFAHENTYDLLVTTNDHRPLEILSAYKKLNGYGFKLRYVTERELLSVFKTDQSRTNNVPCIRMIFSKFYPILNQEADAVIHIDFDTMFAATVDLASLLVSDISLVDANKYWPKDVARQFTNEHADFFRIPRLVTSPWNWINSGVFSVQRRGFQLVSDEVLYYLRNLERAIADGVDNDEIIMNALAIRERDAVSVLSDCHLNFLAYFLKHDPAWPTTAQIIHFQSVKPGDFRLANGVFQHYCDDYLAERINDDLYLAVLMWYRYLHEACRDLPYLFPLLEAIPSDVIEREIAIRSCLIDHW